MGILARDLTETTKDELRDALLPFFTKKTGTGYDGKSLPYRLLARNLYELFFEYTRATLTYTTNVPEAGEFGEATQQNEQHGIALNDADFPYAFLDNIPLDTEVIVTTFGGDRWKGVLKQITRISSPSSYVLLICDVSETTTFVTDDDAVIEIKHTSDTFFNNQDGTAVLEDQLVFIDGTDNSSKRETIKVLFDLLGSKESGTAVAGDSINFIDATDNLVKKEKISAILDLKTLTEIFDSDNGVTASTSMNRTVDEGFDNFSAIIFEMRLNNNRIVTPFVPLDVWEDTTENARIAGSYQDPYFTLYRVDSTTFRYYAGASGMRLYRVYGF